MHQTGGLRGQKFLCCFYVLKLPLWTRRRGHLHYSLIELIRSLKAFNAYLIQQKTSGMNVCLCHRAMQLFLLASYEYFHWHPLIVDEAMLKLTHWTNHFTCCNTEIFFLFRCICLFSNFGRLFKLLRSFVKSTQRSPLWSRISNNYCILNALLAIQCTLYLLAEFCPPSLNCF